ncbi:Gp49 family protein [Escherichia coli]|uniref:Gp49 family protein n=1 Tax=Escherichia coli TaxID=562 RepID=UPI00201ECEB2|nr:Gp49 family protein [Escherichia coli]
MEKEIVEKGKTAPRVTPDHIEGIIAQEAYFTAEDGAFGKAIKAKHTGGEVNYQPHESLSLLTFCVLVLRNGFTVTGESSCASPENFDAEIGRKIARQNAVNKIWMLEGYLLKQKLSEQ